jgi:hypothetical protein
VAGLAGAEFIVVGAHIGVLPDRCAGLQVEGVDEPVVVRR